MTRFLCCLALFAAAAHAATPPNDLFAKAKLITAPCGTLTSESNVGATAEFGEPNVGGATAKHTLWYRIVCPRDGTFVVSAADNLGLRMTLFEGGAEGSFEALYSGYSTTNTQPGDVERLALNVFAGKTLMLAVDSDAPGAFTLRYHTGGTDNDYFEDARNLPGDTGTAYGYSSNATFESEEPPVSGNSAPTIWYKWQAPTSASYTFDTIGSEFDTLLSVFSGSNLTALTAIAENDNVQGVPYPASRVTFAANAGTTYYIRVAGVNQACGQVHLNYYPATNAGQFNISTPNGNQIGATGGKMLLRVRREFGSAGSASVQVATQSPLGSGSVAGTDYVALNQTLTFANGETEKTVNVTILPATQAGDSKVFTITLSNPTNGAVLGDYKVAGVLILGPESTASIDFAHYVNVVREGQLQAQIEFVRKGNPALPVGAYLTFSPSNSFSKAGSDYSPAPTYVQLQPWQMSATVAINLPDDTDVEGIEDVQMSMDGHLGTLRIVDDDTIPSQAATFESAQINGVALGGYLFRATLTPAGLMTGQIKTRGSTLSFKGAVSQTGELAALAPRGGGLGDLQVRLQCQDGMQSVHVQLLSSLGDVRDSFDAPRAFASGPQKTPSPQAGAYTLYATAVTIGQAQAPTPFWCTLNISAAGAVKGVGKLTDGQAVSFGTQQEITGGVHALVPLRAGRELFGMNAGYYPTSGQWDFIGSMIWRKLPIKGDALLPMGVPHTGTGVTAIRYTPPAKGLRALEIWQTSNGNATLNTYGTGFPFTLPNVGMTVTPTNAAIFTTPATSLKLNPKTGVFTGSFKPANHAAVPFGGVLYQGSNINCFGVGSFVSDGLAGKVGLGAP